MRAILPSRQLTVKAHGMSGLQLRIVEFSGTDQQEPNQFIRFQTQRQISDSIGQQLQAAFNVRLSSLIDQQ